MRFIVLLFGFMGCVLTAVVGVAYFWAPEVREIVRGFKIQELDSVLVFIFDPQDKNSLQTGLFMLIAAVFGLLGTLLAFLRCGWQGSLLMFVPLVGPALISPVTLVGTSLQGFTALISMFVGPLPIETPKDDDDDD
jgi:hypothetical protein